MSQSPQSPEDLQPPETPVSETPTNAGGGKAVASLVLGIFGMSGIAFLLPILGVPVTVTGIILGALDLKSPKREVALAGLILSGIGCGLSLLNALVGAIWRLGMPPGHDSAVSCESICFL
jgi:hypothetical protein